MRSVALLLVAVLVLGGTQVLAEAEDTYDVVVLEETWITDRYGDNLKAFLYFPAIGGVKARGRLPVVLTLRYPNPATTSERDRVAGVDPASEAAGFARAGYVHAQVNWNGTAPSDGWDAFFTRRMQLSGYDVVEWLAGFRPDGSPSPAAQWSTGKVGMFGGSGMGYSQILVAQHNPPHLVTITPHVTVTNPYEDVAYRGGIRSHDEAAIIGFLFASTQAHCASVPNDASEAAAIGSCAAKRVERLQIVPSIPAVEWWQHPTYDAYWHPYTVDVAAIKASIWSLGSWDDNFARGNRTLYQQATSPKLFAVGFKGHSIGPGFDLVAETVRWFDYWLKGHRKNGVADDLRKRRFRYYVQRERVWRSAADWPVPGTRYTNYYLSDGADIAGSVGGLSRQLPSSSGFDEYVYEPTQGRHNGQNGVPGRGPGPDTADSDEFLNSNAPLQPGDQRLEADTPTYVGPVLERDTEVTGPIRMTVYASSTAQDTDFVVKLLDVFPEGDADPGRPQPGFWYRVTTGWLKGTHRNGHLSPEPIPVGEVVGYDIEIFATSYLFRAGHRIGVQVGSADASRSWPNPIPAMNTIYRSPQYPSHITLPIIPRS
jgi:putative CocE/NonD family hydrolase